MIFGWQLCFLYFDPQEEMYQIALSRTMIYQARITCNYVKDLVKLIKQNDELNYDIKVLYKEFKRLKENQGKIRSFMQI